MSASEYELGLKLESSFKNISLAYARDIDLSCVVTTLRISRLIRVSISDYKFD
jgi:hypothetical protein